MLVAAAFCPQPPLLVPSLAAGAASELDGVRAACNAALGRMLAAEPELVVVVGDGPALLEYGETSVGSLAGFGVDVRVGLAPSPDPRAPAVLPLSLTVGAWLLHRSAWPGPRLAVAVPATASGDEAARLGRTLAARAPRVALLVMADGSARRSERAPGYVDERAEPFDRTVAQALAHADADALLRLDADLAGHLLVAGRAAWQAAGAAAAAELSAYDPVLHADEAPYGVGYLVASWVPAG